MKFCKNEKYMESDNLMPAPNGKGEMYGKIPLTSLPLYKTYIYAYEIKTTKKYCIIYYSVIL